MKLFAEIFNLLKTTANLLCPCSKKLNKSDVCDALSLRCMTGLYSMFLVIVDKIFKSNCLSQQSFVTLLPHSYFHCSLACNLFSPTTFMDA